MLYIFLIANDTSAITNCITIITNLLQWQPKRFLITVFFQVLFVYPPEKPLPLKCKDLLSFCFPGGLEVRCMFNELITYKHI